MHPTPSPHPPAPATHTPPAARLRAAAALGSMRPAGAVRVAAVAPAARPGLRTGRLVLRPLAPDDHAEFVRVIEASRAHLSRFCPLTTDDRGDEPAEAVWARQLELSRRAVETGLAWRRIAVRAAGPMAGRIAGAVNVNDIGRGFEDHGELVFWVGADAAREGLGTEMVGAALAHALEDRPRGLGLHRVTALIDPANAPCVRLARRVGLRLEPDHPPTALRLGARTVLHDTYAAYAPVTGVVEGKPSVAESVLGRGLLSILRTETTPPFPPAGEPDSSSRPRDDAR